MRIAWLRDMIAPGSHLAITHAVFEGARPDTSPLTDVYQKILGRHEGVGPRPIDEVARFFDGFEMVEPGLVYVRR